MRLDSNLTMALYKSFAYLFTYFLREFASGVNLLWSVLYDTITKLDKGMVLSIHFSFAAEIVRMPRGSSRSVSKTKPTAEKRVTRGSVRSPAAKTSPAVKSPVKSSAAVSSPKKSAVPAARSRSRAATSKSPQPQPQQQRGRSISTKRKSSSPKTAK